MTGFNPIRRLKIMLTRPAPEVAEAAGVHEPLHLPDHEYLVHELASCVNRCYERPVHPDRAAEARHAFQTEWETILRLNFAVVGKDVPILLARDGVHTIPFQKLVDARAKIQALEAELSQLRPKGATP